MVPSKVVTLKQFRLMLKPWITKDILRKCNERDSLLMDIKNENDPVRKKILRTNFNILRTQVTKEKRQSKKSYFAAQFEKNKNKISKEKKECILMGDFNIDLLKSTGDNAAGKFHNTLNSYFFTPYILQPTRLRSKTLIDNIFFNSLEYHSYSGNLLYELSDHLTQFLILEGFIKERSLPETVMQKRDFENLNLREFDDIVINGVN